MKQNKCGKQDVSVRNEKKKTGFELETPKAEVGVVPADRKEKKRKRKRKRKRKKRLLIKIQKEEN